MCHTIEDPTFDATAVATNPRAQIRPIHRPPRVPADRHPHCHWTVTIDESNPPVDAHPNAALVAALADRELRRRRPRSERGAGRVGRLLGPVRHRLRARGPLPTRARRGVAGVRGAEPPPPAGVLPRRRGAPGCGRRHRHAAADGGRPRRGHGRAVDEGVRLRRRRARARGAAAGAPDLLASHLRAPGASSSTATGCGSRCSRTRRSSPRTTGSPGWRRSRARATAWCSRSRRGSTGGPRSNRSRRPPASAAPTSSRCRPTPRRRRNSPRCR